MPRPVAIKLFAVLTVSQEQQRLLLARSVSENSNGSQLGLVPFATARTTMLDVSMTILKCIPPLQGKDVRTLSQQFSLGTPPWNTVIEQKSYFLGAESVAGQAVITASVFVVQNIRNHDDPSMVSIHQDEHVRSALALPLQRDGQIAGCLLVQSTQPNFFTPLLITLILQYSHLLAIVLHDDELYAREQIDLQMVPPIPEQQYYLAHLRDRVSALIKHSYRTGQPKLSTPCTHQ